MTDKTTALLPVPETTSNKLDLFGLPAICALIANGLTHRDVARQLAINPGDLSAWIANRSDGTMYRKALEASAEQLMDEADALMERAANLEFITPAQVALLKLRVEQLTRRAGMRSKYHRDKPADDQSSAPSFCPTIVINGVSPHTPVNIIDHAG